MESTKPSSKPRNQIKTKMSNEEETNNNKPIIILHHFPSFKPTFLPKLYSTYTVLDQHSDPPDPSFSTRSISARLLLCLGPTPLNSSALDSYPSVECVVGSSAGVNHFDLAELKRRRIRVTNAGEVFSDDVADYAVGLAVDVSRRVSVGDRFVKAGGWGLHTEFELGFKVSGKRVGIVGLGSIGYRVAKRFEAFNCKIAYNSRKMKPDIPYPFYANVVDLASNSDILIACCALTDETHHVINRDVMTALGKTGIIINVGRGKLIDEKELVQFLARGDIGGAGLDVFENEPHVPKELWGLDNVVLSPHKAVITHESFAALEDLIMSNLEAFFSNKPLRAEIQLN